MGPPPYELIVTMVQRDRVRLEVDDHDVPLRSRHLVRASRAFAALRRSMQVHGASGRHLPATPPPPQGNSPFAHGA